MTMCTKVHFFAKFGLDYALIMQNFLCMNLPQNRAEIFPPLKSVIFFLHHNKSYKEVGYIYKENIYMTQTES